MSGGDFGLNPEGMIAALRCAVRHAASRYVKAKKRKPKALLHFPAGADKQAGESGRAYVTSPRLLPVARHWCVEFGATNGKAIESPALPCRAAKRKEAKRMNAGPDYAAATESERARVSMCVCVQVLAV
ncbi:hypothetical protein MTO96_017042 [Rhipicephalus appendiculatus]